MTLVANHLHAMGSMVVRQASWYEKPAPTFSDALAAVRRHLWKEPSFFISPCDSEIVQISRGVLNRLTDSLAYAA